MAKQLKVGDEVMIKESSEYFICAMSSNPIGIKGVISANDGSGDHAFRVKWSNGETNVYNPQDLKKFKLQEQKDMVGKEKTYTDPEGDVFEVDTLNSDAFVYFTTGEGEDGIGEGQIVRLRAEDVKKIRKQLGQWLDIHGHRV